MSFKKCITFVSTLMFFSVAQAERLRVTSLNIEWYGRGGVIEGNPELEYRDTTLRRFLLEDLPRTDVFVFQEITEPQMLMDLFPELNCFTYRAGTKRHQHIVICAERGRLVETSVNHEVRLKKLGLRPALSGTFKFDGKKAFSVIGLHLKAGPFNTDVRLNQVQELLKEFKASDKSLILGDLNTYDKDRTGLKESDRELMDRLFQKKGFSEVEQDTPTYLGFKKRLFDRAWSANLLNTESRVYGPCNKNLTKKPFSKFKFYKRFVSDHCALQIEFDVEEEKSSKKIEETKR